MYIVIASLTAKNKRINEKDNDVTFLCFISKNAALPETCLENVPLSLQYCAVELWMSIN